MFLIIMGVTSMGVTSTPWKLARKRRKLESAELPLQILDPLIDAQDCRPMTFFNPDPYLAEKADRSLTHLWQQFPNLQHDQLALTWVVYDHNPRTTAWAEGTGQENIPIPSPGSSLPGFISGSISGSIPGRGYSYRGDQSIYPASVVKLFYLVAIYAWFAQGQLQPSGELNRAMRDMIVDSSNDATGLVVDLLSATTSGPELAGEEFEQWKHQRNVVNRYLQSLGWPEFKDINVNQKTWCDGPYGREQAFVGVKRENRNLLTTNASARLLQSMISGTIVSASACQSILPLLARSLDPADLAADPENQVTGFLGAGLPQIAKIWSKAGLTSQVRHDAAYIEVPNCPPYLLVVFTEGKEHSNNEKILPFLSQQFLNALL